MRCGVLPGTYFKIIRLSAPGTGAARLSLHPCQNLNLAQDEPRVSPILPPLSRPTRARLFSCPGPENWESRASKGIRTPRCLHARTQRSRPRPRRSRVLQA